MNAKLQLNLNQLNPSLSLSLSSFFHPLFFFLFLCREKKDTLNTDGENQSFRFEVILN